jgi:hypothetical protein
MSGSFTGPMRTRFRRTTGWPTESNISRTWRCRPSWIVISTIVCSPLSLTIGSDARSFAGEVRRPSIVTPRARRSSVCASGTPRTRASYTLSTSCRGCVRRVASSPSLVSSSNPSVS